MIQNAWRNAAKEVAQQVFRLLFQFFEKPYSNESPRNEIQQTLEAKESLQLIEDPKDQSGAFLRPVSCLPS